MELEEAKISKLLSQVIMNTKCFSILAKNLLLENINLCRINSAVINHLAIKLDLKENAYQRDIYIDLTTLDTQLGDWSNYDHETATAVTYQVKICDIIETKALVTYKMGNGYSYFRITVNKHSYIVKYYYNNKQIYNLTHLCNMGRTSTPNISSNSLTGL